MKTLDAIIFAFICTIFTAFSASKDYMVIDLSGGQDAEEYPITYLSSVPKCGWTDEYKTNKLVLRRINPGTFTRADPGYKRRVDNGSYEEITYKVKLTKAFYIGVFEVTYQQWELVMGSIQPYLNPTCPIRVSYDVIRGSSDGTGWPENNRVDADSFMGKLRNKTGQTFDLPTEAQWEYASRSGIQTHLNNGKNIYGENGISTALHNVAWYSQNSEGQRHPVGLKQPNRWGLFDMHGNVYEWCLDIPESYRVLPVKDPKGRENDSRRWMPVASCAGMPSRPIVPTFAHIVRGGSWESLAKSCESGRRSHLPSCFVAGLRITAPYPTNK